MLEIAALGDVLRDPDDTLDVTAIVTHGEPTVVDPPHRAVGSLDPVLDIEPAGRELVQKGVAGAPAIMRGDGVGPVEAGLVDRVYGSAPDPLEGGAHVEHVAPFHVGHPEHFVDVLGQLTERRLVFGQHTRFAARR